MRWLILAGIAWYLYTQGAFRGLGQWPVPMSTLETPLPGGYSVSTPLPEGWRAWRLSDGSQVVVRPEARTAPWGWVQAEHQGQLVWFNEYTGELRSVE